MEKPPIKTVPDPVRGGRGRLETNRAEQSLVVGSQLPKGIYVYNTKHFFSEIFQHNRSLIPYDKNLPAPA